MSPSAAVFTPRSYSPCTSGVTGSSRVKPICASTSRSFGTTTRRATPCGSGSVGATRRAKKIAIARGKLADRLGLRAAELLELRGAKRRLRRSGLSALQRGDRGEHLRVGVALERGLHVLARLRNTGQQSPRWRPSARPTPRARASSSSRRVGDRERAHDLREVRVGRRAHQQRTFSVHASSPCEPEPGPLRRRTASARPPSPASASRSPRRRSAMRMS